MENKSGRVPAAELGGVEKGPKGDRWGTGLSLDYCWS